MQEGFSYGSGSESGNVRKINLSQNQHQREGREYNVRNKATLHTVTTCLPKGTLEN
jgi:hypothetical protein